MGKNRYIVILSLLLTAILVSGCGATQAKTGDTVKVHYTGTLKDGSVFDTSIDREPLEFTLGQGQLIPGFEQAVIGMTVGESKTINIPADQAYGLYNNDLISVIDCENVPEGMNPEVGQQFQAQLPEHSAVLDYYLTPTHTYIFCITHSDLALIEVEGVVKQIQGEWMEFFRGKAIENGNPFLQSDVSWKPILVSFYNLLIGSVEISCDLKDIEELIIIPDGLLYYVPFAALIDSTGNYLIEKKEQKPLDEDIEWLKEFELD